LGNNPASVEDMNKKIKDVAAVSQEVETLLQESVDAAD
jgi:hypothetical protein